MGALIHGYVPAAVLVGIPMYSNAAGIVPVVERLGIAVAIEKVTDYARVAGYGVASTPGIVVDGTVVHAGGLPRSQDVAPWLAA